VPADTLGFVARTRVAAGQRLLSLALGWPWLRNRLVARHSAPVDGRTLDPQLAVLLGLGELVDPEPELSRFAPSKARAKLIEQVATVEAPPPPGVRTEERSFPGPASPLTVRLYTPEGLEAPSPAVFYLHGGGWVTCGLDTHDGFCRRIALGARCRVVAVDYRLAPEHRFPAAVEDSLTAFRWMMAQAEELGIDPTRVAVSGDSAGGNLSAVLSLHTREEARRPALQVLLYPAMDATRSLPSQQRFQEGYFLTGAMMDWYYGHYLGGTKHLRHPDASPLFAPDVRGAPEALIYTAGFDTLRDEGRAYADKLREAGVPVVYREFESLVHGFTLMTGAIESARKAVEEIAGEVGRHLRGKTAQDA
jgi:acetyl esterase